MNKTLIVLLILICRIVSAQVNIDSVLSSVNYQEPDTVNISRIVQAQIEEAKAKAMQEEHKPVVKENPVAVSSISVPVANLKGTEKHGLFSFFGTLKPEVIVFTIISSLLIASVLLRRIVISSKKKMKNSIKQKIAMIREENVILKPDRKRRKVRLLLRKNKFVEKIASGNINSKARELEISKGEILLASRIKILEYGK